MAGLAGLVSAIGEAKHQRTKLVGKKLHSCIPFLTRSRDSTFYFFHLFISQMHASSLAKKMSGAELNKREDSRNEDAHFLSLKNK